MITFLNQVKSDFSHVLFVGPYNPNGGIGAVISKLAVSMSGIKTLSLETDGSRFKKLILFLYGVASFLRYLVIHYKVSIVHFHSASNASFYRKSTLCLLAMLFKKKIVFHIHGGGFKEFYRSNRFTKWYVKKILNNANHVICLSEEWKQFFDKEIGLKNTSVVPNPVDDYQSNRLPVIPYPLRLLFLGTVNEEKGIFDLLNYLRVSPIFSQYPIELHIGGIVEPGLNNRFSELINSHSRFIFHGWIGVHDKQKIFDCIDVFILPSYIEGLPVSILEAMSFSKPIIATRVGGIPSLVKEGVNGWLIDHRDFSRLEAILHHLLIDDHALLHFGANSKFIVQSYYTHKAVAKLSTVYTNL